MAMGVGSGTGMGSSRVGLVRVARVERVGGGRRGRGAGGGGSGAETMGANRSRAVSSFSGGAVRADEVDETTGGGTTTVGKGSGLVLTGEEGGGRRAGR